VYADDCIIMFLLKVCLCDDGYSGAIAVQVGRQMLNRSWFGQRRGVENVERRYGRERSCGGRRDGGCGIDAGVDLTQGRGAQLATVFG